MPESRLYHAADASVLPSHSFSCAGARPFDRYLACEILQLILLFMAMWGLMILFFASRGLLAQFKPDLKIIALKVVIIIGSLQNILVPVIVAQVYGEGEE